MLETLKNWDRELFVFLNNLGLEQFDSFWIFVTQIESWTPLFIYFAVLIFYFYRGKKGLVMIFFLILTFTVTIVFTNLVKDFVGRLRPNNEELLFELIRVLQKPTTFSFFSGHAASSFSITTFVVLALRKFNAWIYLAYIWPILFVLSRIYVGVHYPSDIFVGALVGVIFAYSFFRLSQVILKKL